MSNETADQKRTRRRWLTLAELVAVAGVVIAALSLWQNRADRLADKADRVATSAAEAKEKARVELTATVAGGGRLLRLADQKHDIADVTIAWPQALGVAAQHPAGDPVIDADAITAPLLRLTDGGADDRTGRVPALVTVTYIDGNDSRSASGIYDVVWATHGRFGRGRALVLTGMRLRQRGGNAAALERAWAREKP